MHRVEEAFKELFAEAIRLGGTITGEHGVGVAEKAFLPQQVGETGLRLMRTLRQVPGPQGVLNPGKVI